MSAVAFRPKVAFITARFPFGPMEAFLGAEIRSLASQFDVTIVPTIRDSDHVVSADMSGLTAASMGPLSKAALREAIHETLREPRLVGRTLVAVVRGPRGLAAKLKNLAIFPKAVAVARELRRRGVEHVHAYWLSAPSTIAFVAAELNGITWSATGHRYDLVDFNMTSTGRLPRAGFLVRAEFVRTISERGRIQALRALGERFKLRVHAIHLGVRIPPARKVAAHSQTVPLRLVCAAELVPVKGHDVLLRSLASAKARGVNVACDIVGDGPLRATLIALARELDLNDVVTFAGALPHDALMRRFDAGQYDAAILTSVDDGWRRCEGIPVCLMEAMAAGCPVIATDSGSVSELVDGSNGILVPPGAEAEIAGAIEKLAGDPSYRERLGANARSTVERAFSIGTTSQDVGALLQRAARAPYDRGTF